MHGGVDIGVPARQLGPQVACVVSAPHRRDRIDRDVLDDEMRRHQHQTADAVILMRPGIDRGDRGAIAVAEQQPAPEADGIEQGGQNHARLVVHVGHGARQLGRR